MKLHPHVAILLIGSMVTAAAVARSLPPASTTLPVEVFDYKTAAVEVTRHIQKEFGLGNGLYARSRKDRRPEFMWGNGILFSSFAGAARHEPQSFSPLLPQFFGATNSYWDRTAKIPGYEPLPTTGGHDKYYDDNAWMVITFVEAYEMTGERRYLDRAEAALAFVLSGWDDVYGGGIWWHEGHNENAKNTCSNAPAAVACLRVAMHQPSAKAKANVAMAQRIVDWTVKNLQLGNGLFADGVNVQTGRINTDALTYNTALMIRAWLGLYRATGDQRYFAEAKRSAAASDWFADKSGAYRDALRWSHLMVEADLEMYRATGDEHLLARATANARHEYELFKTNSPAEVMDVASIARTLWLMADHQSESGLAFWKKVDAGTTPPVKDRGPAASSPSAE